jgi:hypothetical protein
MPEVLDLAGFHFLRPLWLLLLLPFLALSVLQWRRSDLARQWQTLIAPHLLPRMVVRGSERRLFSPIWVSTLLSPLLVFTLAGPSWERGDSPFAQDSRGAGDRGGSVREHGRVGSAAQPAAARAGQDTAAGPGPGRCLYRAAGLRGDRAHRTAAHR